MNFHPGAFIDSLYYMGVGMLGIMIVIGVIIGITVLLNKITGNNKEKGAAAVGLQRLFQHTVYTIRQIRRLHRYTARSRTTRRQRPKMQSRGQPLQVLPYVTEESLL